MRRARYPKRNSVLQQVEAEVEEEKSTK